MSTQSVEITSKGIRKVLNKYTPQRAIAEYIWNGYDANATEVRISIHTEDAFDSITEISVNDNGEGIVYDLLPIAFRKFYESHKTANGNLDSRFSRGKNGYGRFTFFKFATDAYWSTVYMKDNQFFKYGIKINSDNLTHYESTEVTEVQDLQPGTTVTFTNITNDDLSKPWVENVLLPYLRAEFAWYFKIHPDHKLYVNDNFVDCSSIIADSEFFDISIELEGIEPELFHCSYFQWAVKPQDEFSRFYFMAADGMLKFQKTTLFNNKGDSFWHSVLVKSTFFNSLPDVADEDRPNLFSSLPERKVFKAINDRLNECLQGKRRPFLKKQAELLVDSYDQERVFAFIGSTPWEEARKVYLTNFIKELYEVEPSVFSRLNDTQRSIFVRLLDQVMDTDNNDSLFRILGEVVELDQSDKDRFAEILNTTRLKCVISTIQLLTDRLKTISAFRAINFDHSLRAGEVKHLQKLIESNYWIFGEEYRFVCAEEAKFEEALAKYRYLLHGVSEKEYIDHPDKYKEMDLFVSGKEHRDNRPSNLVVEIKNPTTVPSLKMEQYSQIVRYMNVIMSQDRFNDSSEYWTFMLIGLNIDDEVIPMMRNKITGLCVDEPHYQLYIKKWSQILNESEARVNFLIDKLQIERDKLSLPDTADEIVEQSIHNSAAYRPDEESMASY